VLALERLHPSLFIDAEHDFVVRRRRQVEVADTANLRREVGVGAVQPDAHAMRSDLFIAQCPANLAGAELKARRALERHAKRVG